MQKILQQAVNVKVILGKMRLYGRIVHKFTGLQVHKLGLESIRHKVVGKGEKHR